MAAFNQYCKCTRCCNKGLGSEPCVLKTEWQFCNALTSDQKSQLATPTYRAKEDKKIASPLPSLVDLGSVQILGQFENKSKTSDKVTTEKNKMIPSKETVKKKVSSNTSSSASEK